MRYIDCLNKPDTEFFEFSPERAKQCNESNAKVHNKQSGELNILNWLVYVFPR